MNTFDTFTKKQKQTHLLVHDLELELMNSVDPTTFILNPDTMKIRHEIERVQAECDHIWENGVCLVCGKEESNK